MKKFKKPFISILMITLIVIMIPYTAFAKEYTIKDLDSGSNYYDEVQQVLNQGWMGLALNKFYPDKKVTRGEFAVILAKFTGNINSFKAPKKNTFKDISTKNQYFKYIEAEKNYIPYYKTKQGLYFKPTNYITREDAVTAIIKAMGYGDKNLQDGQQSDISLDEILEDSNKISPANKEYISIAINNELIALYDVGDKTYFYPTKYISRVELADLLLNTYNNADLTKDNGNIDESSNSSKSSNNSSSKDNNNKNIGVSNCIVIGDKTPVESFEAKYNISFAKGFGEEAFQGLFNPDNITNKNIIYFYRIGNNFLSSYFGKYISNDDVASLNSGDIIVKDNDNSKLIIIAANNDKEFQNIIDKLPNNFNEITSNTN